MKRASNEVKVFARSLAKTLSSKWSLQDVEKDERSNSDDGVRHPKSKSVVIRGDRNGKIVSRSRIDMAEHTQQEAARAVEHMQSVERQRSVEFLLASQTATKRRRRDSIQIDEDNHSIKIAGKW